jgi:hypothetical protein
MTLIVVDDHFIGEIQITESDDFMAFPLHPSGD